MKSLHVAVGIIIDGHRILLAQRPLDKHQGGRWEFPGGKCEADESVEQALIRELQEELGITPHPTGLTPFECYHHRYPEHEVLLDCWWVNGFDGEPHGNEGQPIRWVSVDQLQALTFPEANRPIVEHLQQCWKKQRWPARTPS